MKTIKIDEVDRLRIIIQNERVGRISTELDLANTERRLLMVELASKYGFKTGDKLDINSGIIQIVESSSPKTEPPKTGE
jgi:hypothetical protein